MQQIPLMIQQAVRLILLAIWAPLFLTGCLGDTLQDEEPDAGFSAIDRNRISQARTAALDMRNMLDEYYGGSMVLEQSWYLSPDHPARQQGMEFLAEKLARALVWQQPFVIGTIGSSVTAGHDNCRYDCYQQQLERLLGPVLWQGGVPYEVRNTGQGGECVDSYNNQVWCLPMLVGDDVDVTHYSWTYWEAGRGKLVPSVHEMFYRWSLMMDRSPAPQLIYANNCEQFNDRDQAVLTAYAPFGADVLCMTRGLEKAGYKKGEWGEIGDSLHETTREGEAPGISEQRRKSLGVAAVELIEPPGNGWMFDHDRTLQKYVPEEERSLPQCEHPIRCSGWVAPAGEQTGWLSFSLPELELGLVAVCCSHKKCGQQMLDAGVEFLLDGKPSFEAPEVLWDGKCVQVQAEFRQDAKRTVRLDLRLPPQEQALPPITREFGL